MATDRAYRKFQEAGALNTIIAGGGSQLGAISPVQDATNTVSAIHSDLFPIYKSADDAAAATATAETYSGIFFPQTQGLSTVAGQRLYRVNNVYYVATTGGITGDPTNNATINIFSRNATGGNQLLVASLTTTVANTVTQGAGIAFAMNSANILLPAGATITWSITKGGTGVIVRAGIFTLDVEAI